LVVSSWESGVWSASLARFLVGIVFIVAYSYLRREFRCCTRVSIRDACSFLGVVVGDMQARFSCWQSGVCSKAESKLKAQSHPVSASLGGFLAAAVIPLFDDSHVMFAGAEHAERFDVRNYDL
jgi:hypothetical protein